MASSYTWESRTTYVRRTQKPTGIYFPLFYQQSLAILAIWSLVQQTSLVGLRDQNLLDGVRNTFRGKSTEPLLKLGAADDKVPPLPRRALKCLMCASVSGRRWRKNTAKTDPFSVSVRPVSLAIDVKAMLNPTRSQSDREKKQKTRGRRG